MQFVNLSHISIRNNVVCLNDKQIFACNPADDFRTFAKACYQNLNIDYAKFYKMDKLCKLGFLATEILLDSVDITQFADDEVAILLSNSSSSLNDDFLYQSTIDEVPSPAVFVYTLGNIVIGEICIRHKMYGESTFFVSNDDNRDFLRRYAQTIVDEHRAKAFIIGRVEIDAADNYFADLEFLVAQ